MRITLLCNLDIASNLAANQLINALPEHQFSVLMTSQVGGNNKRPDALEALSFYENALFTQILFPALECDKGTNKQRHLDSAIESSQNKDTPLLTFDAMKQRGIDIHIVSNINEGNGLERLTASNPELVLSVRFGRILKEPALNVPQNGVLNLHSGLLPQYRGIMATFWSMLKGEPQIGCTLHRIQDAGIDTGDIVSIHPIGTDYDKSYFDNMLAIYPQGLEAMIDAVKRIADGKQLDALSQDMSQAGYFTMPDQASITLFEQKGYRWVNHDKLIMLAKRFMPNGVVM